MKTMISPFHFNLDKSLFKEETDSLLFFDIETTGFSAQNSFLYMIGSGYFSEGRWVLRQFLAEGPEDEKELIESFFELLKNYKMLIHFNGDSFDIPYICKRCSRYGINTHYLKHMESFDIYKKIFPYRKIFPTENIKQKTVEAFMGTGRKDETDGGMLIEVYKNYIKSYEKDKEELLLNHNHDDVQGLIKMTPILYYIEMFKGNDCDYAWDFSEYQRPGLDTGYELNIVLTYQNKAVTPFSFHKEGVYFKIHGDKLYISVKGMKTRLKYFFKDYKNYYYLPVEDMAVHKSVASYVDKEYRQQALPSNCYIQKEGIFLPAFSMDYPRVFKEDYKDKKSYILFSDDSFQSDNFIRQYIKAVLSVI